MLMGAIGLACADAILFVEIDNTISSWFQPSIRWKERRLLLPKLLLSNGKSCLRIGSISCPVCRVI